VKLFKSSTIDYLKEFNNLRHPLIALASAKFFLEANYKIELIIGAYFS